MGSTPPPPRLIKGLQASLALLGYLYSLALCSKCLPLLSLDQPDQHPVVWQLSWWGHTVRVRIRV